MLDLVQSAINNFYSFINEAVSGDDMTTAFLITMLSGSILYFFRKVPELVYSFYIRNLTVTIGMNSDSIAYYNVMRYLIENNLIEKIRNANITNGNSTWHDSDNPPELNIGYGSFLTILNRKIVHISHSRVSENTTGVRVINKITLTFLGRSTEIITKFLQEAKKKHDETPGIIMKRAGEDEFYYVNKQPYRPFSTIDIPEPTKNTITNSIDKFIKNEQYCLDKGLPYQFGILLYGPPGTGKTSIIKAIATHLDRPIVMVSDIGGLVNACSNARKELIAVEEIDTLSISKRDSTTDKNKTSEETFVSDIHKKNLRDILTTLDGLVYNHGRFIVATTNHVEELDKALIRPGRFDMVIYIGYATEETFYSMVCRLKEVDIPTRLRKIKDNVSLAEVQGDILADMDLESIMVKYTY